ncbi:MAG: AAA family ATPase [Alphaproteobacteria bacterium]|nr:AAA family ATPase [Alphaproteobacteria bacterium]
MSTPLDNIDKTDNFIEAFRCIEDGGSNLLILGSAGSGKSTFIDYLRNNTTRQIACVAPTAISAINIEGSTIHSFFGLPPKDFFPTRDLVISRKLKTVLRNLEVLIIDEISMVRPDMLDAINSMCQESRGSLSPFGGIQLILIGDLYQLPPIIRRDVEPLFLRKYGYSSPYFFDSESYITGNFRKIFFDKIYRQKDLTFVKNLNRMRDLNDLEDVIGYFNQRIRGSEEIDKLREPVLMTPYRSIAEEINKRKLSEILEIERTYSGSTTGTFMKFKDFPSPKELVLKNGCRIMFNKNNRPLWSNGDTGTILSMSDDRITVVLNSSQKLVDVHKEKWQHIRYTYNMETQKIVEEITGEYEQFPLQLGYGITIHKSQGKTLENIVIDLGRGTFAHGQLYVAFSRAKHLEDIYLKRAIKITDIIVDTRIIEFYKN